MKQSDTTTEKPRKECPLTCGDCEYFESDICTANNCKTSTQSFSNPKDRPLPMPLNCYWWYLNSVWDKLSHHKILKYKEERLHMFIAEEYLRTLQGEQRNQFIDHWLRPGGCKLIDFKLYPEAEEIYMRLKEEQ